MSVTYKYPNTNSRIIKNVTIKITPINEKPLADPKIDKLYEYPFSPPLFGYTGLIGDKSKNDNL